MSNPLHAPFYADQGVCCEVTVLERRELARDTYWMRLACPEIAARITPGQFIMLRLPGSAEPLLGRAFAMYDVAKQASGDAFAIDIVFYVVGKLTSRLAELPAGGALEVWGPLGNGFLPRPAEHLIMVAGGIGQTPFMALAKECLGRQQYGAPPRPAAHATKVTLCYGARSADLFAGLDDFAALGVETLLATDDGSQGRRGLVTDVFRDALAAAPDGSRVVCCGPEPMMEAVALICREGGVACEVSLETPMACGLGICFSCVARVSERDGTWDYKRTCVEGPVFDAARLVW